MSGTQIFVANARFPKYRTPSAASFTTATTSTTHRPRPTSSPPTTASYLSTHRQLFGAPLVSITRVDRVHHILSASDPANLAYPSLVMSSYSSSSSASALSPASSTRYQASAEESGLWRTRSLRSDASASRQVRHVASRGRGSGTRHLDWEHRERSSNLSETQSSLPGSQTLRREHGYAEGHDGRHIAIQVSSDDRNASKLRGQSGAHNEAGVSRALRPSGGPRLQSPSSQAHQSYHADVGYSASNRRLLTRLGPAQVSPATHTAAPLPPSSPLSRSPPFPLTPPRHRSPAVDKLSCTPLSHSSSASSLASSRLPALSLGPPFDQPTTSSPSPRSQRTRFNRLVRVPP